MMRRPSLLWAVALIALLSGRATTPAVAHPLGNFTINHYARLEPRPDRLDLTVLFDMAEIPTFQEMDRLDRDGNGQVSAAEQSRYVREAGPAIVRELQLRCDGAILHPRLLRQSLTLREGQGGLSCLRWEMHLEGVYPASQRVTHRLQFRDDSFASRLGWREIVARAGRGVTMASSSAPSSERSQMLRAYPEDLLQSPLDERTALCTIAVPLVAMTPRTVTTAISAPHSAASAAAVAGERTSPPAHPASAAHATHATASRFALPTDRFAALIAHRELTWPVILLSLLLAVGLGALHALSPGHGKSVVAAYLVGSRGTAKHAVFLGLVITVTHTIGVFALGLITLVASRWIMTEALYPWLGFASGILVAVIGGMLFHERIEQLIGRTVEHKHLFWKHSHVPAMSAAGLAGGPNADAALSWRSLAGLGVSGGLVPCPSAIVVMLSAIALHRIGFGMVLIAAFSLGLAIVLVSLGVLFVYGARLLPRGGSNSWVMRVAPIGSAIVVAALGLAMAVQSLVAGGVLTLHV